MITPGHCGYNQILMEVASRLYRTDAFVVSLNDCHFAGWPRASNFDRNFIEAVLRHPNREEQGAGAIPWITNQMGGTGFKSIT